MFGSDQQRRNYLTRSLFHDVPTLLSPVQEEEESFETSRHSPRARPPAPPSPRPYSPLPPLIIEVEKRVNKHDEPEEFYVELEKKMKRIYRRLFIEGRNVYSGLSTTDDDDSHSNDINRSEERSSGGVDIEDEIERVPDIYVEPDIEPTYEPVVDSDRSGKRRIVSDNASIESDEGQKPKKSKSDDSVCTVLPKSSSKTDFDDDIESSYAEETEEQMNEESHSEKLNTSVEEDDGNNIQRDEDNTTSESVDYIQVTFQADVHRADEPVNEINFEQRNEIEDEPDNEIDDEQGNEIDYEPDNELDDEADSEMELDNEMDDEPDNEIDDEQDNELDDKTDSEMDNEPDNEIDDEPENEINDEQDNEMDDEPDSEIDNEPENRIDDQQENEIVDEPENQIDDEQENLIDVEPDNEMGNVMDDEDNSADRNVQDLEAENEEIEEVLENNEVSGDNISTACGGDVVTSPQAPSDDEPDVEPEGEEAMETQENNRIPYNTVSAPTLEREVEVMRTKDIRPSVSSLPEVYLPDVDTRRDDESDIHFMSSNRSEDTSVTSLVIRDAETQTCYIEITYPEVWREILYGQMKVFKLCSCRNHVCE